MSRGNLDHTEEMLYKQSREHLNQNENGVISPLASGHSSSWEHEGVYTGENKSSSSLSFKIFIISSLLCVFAGAFLFYTITIRPATIDSKKITINLTASPFIEGGQEQTLGVSLSNGNNIALDEASLTLTYDKGGTITGEPDKVTITKDVGQVMPLAVIKQDFPYTLYGGLSEKKSLTVRLDYKIKGSNAIFPKETSTEVTLSVPPLLVGLEGQETVVSGDQSEYTIVIKNNTSTTSPESILSISAPTGFSLIKISQPQIDKAFAWDISPLKSGEEKRIAFTGVFTGVVGEKASLKATIGSRGADTNLIAELFSSDTKNIQYVRPGLSEDLTLETDRGAGTVLRKGDKVTATIQYRNDGASKISYAEFKIALPDSIDPRQIFVNQNGYYDIETHSIIWSSDAYDRLLTLSSGQSGILVFTFVVPADFKDASLPLAVSSKGTDSGIGKIIASLKDFSFVVSGSTAFNAYTMYKDDIAPNTGPLPPKVGTETTYTAILTISSQSDLQNGKVVFTIPSLYVKYLSGTSASSSFSFDTKNKLVTWYIGDIKKDMSQTARIKLSVKPSLTHIGTAPVVSSKVVFSAEDLLTKEKIQQVSDPFSTDIKDKGNEFDLGKVVR